MLEERLARAAGALEHSVAGVDATERLRERGRRRRRQQIATIALPAAPTRMAVTGEAVWVLTPADNNLVRIDPATNEVVATIGGGRAPGGDDRGRWGRLGRLGRERRAGPHRPRPATLPGGGR